MSTGKCEWLIPDAFFPVKDNGDYVSHEAICILNTTDCDAVVDFTLYFEDREPMDGFFATCGARRTHHVRMDRIKSKSNEAVPRGVPYAVYVKSNVPVVVQYSRCDTTQPELAFMGVMAY